LKKLIGVISVTLLLLLFYAVVKTFHLVNNGIQRGPLQLLFRN